MPVDSTICSYRGFSRVIIMEMGVHVKRTRKIYYDSWHITKANIPAQLKDTITYST